MDDREWFTLHIEIADECKVCWNRFDCSVENVPYYLLQVELNLKSVLVPPLIFCEEIDNTSYWQVKSGKNRPVIRCRTQCQFNYASIHGSFLPPIQPSISKTKMISFTIAFYHANTIAHFLAHRMNPWWMVEKEYLWKNAAEKCIQRAMKWWKTMIQTFLNRKPKMSDFIFFQERSLQNCMNQFSNHLNCNRIWRYLFEFHGFDWNFFSEQRYNYFWGILFWIKIRYWE